MISLISKNLGSHLPHMSPFGKTLICSLSTTSSSLARYNPYPKLEEPPSPFKPGEVRRFRQKFFWKYYDGGPLPRPEGSYEDKPIRKMPQYEQKLKDRWDKTHALFGQNDYIDILGDGTIHPAQTMKGPIWLRGFKGLELQRNIRRLKYEGDMLAHLYPTKLHNIKKNIFYQYKRLNLNRRKAPFWTTGSNRIEDIRDKGR